MVEGMAARGRGAVATAEAMPEPLRQAAGILGNRVEDTVKIRAWRIQEEANGGSIRAEGDAGETGVDYLALAVAHQYRGES